MTDASQFRSSFFRLQDEQGVAVLNITRPRLTDEENLEQLEQELSALVDTFQVRQIVLDLNDVHYMTSAAIGKLIALHRRLARGGGQLVLCSLQPDVSAVFEASHLIDYFKVSSSPSAALAQLG